MIEHGSIDRERLLEANLSALFARAYSPLSIREGFAGEVQRSAAAALQRAPTVRSRLLVAALAAAASFLIACGCFAVYECSEFARDRILARREIAAREAAGRWSGLAGGANEARLALGARALELCAGEGQVVLVQSGEGAVAFAGPIHAVVAPSGRGADVRVSAGEICLRDFLGRVHGDFGSFECAGADLDLSADSAGSVRAWLSQGRARFGSPDGKRRDLELGQLFDTHPQIALAISGLAATGGALPTSSVSQREPQPADPNTTLPAPGSAAALEGSVRATDLQAIPAFRVLLLREVELPRTAEPIAQDFEGASGRFRFETIEPGRWTLFVRAEGFALWTREHLTLGGAAVALEVVLERGAGLAGRVIDASSGAPLAGVVLISESDIPASLVPFDQRESPDNPAALALSDAQGRFRFEQLAARSTVVRATRAGYAPRWSAAILPASPTPEVSIEMSPGGSIAGHIEREDGSAHSGTGVVAMPQRAVFDLPRRSYGWALTDARGSYRLDDLPPGPCVVVRVDTARAEAEKDAREPRRELREATIRQGAVQTVDFLAPPQGSRLTGRVLRADGSPLAATISIMPADGPTSEQRAAPGDWRSQLCGADGRFEFTDVLPGRYEIYLGVRTPMDIVRVDAIEVLSESNVDRVLIAPAGELGGSVFSAVDGKPIMFAALVLEREDAQGLCEFAGKVFSDESGAWRILHLANGRYRLRAYAGRGLGHAGRDGIQVQDAVAPAPIVFALEPGSPLELRVSDERGAALGGVEIRLFDGAGVEFQPAERSRTDAEGRCVLDSLPAGRTRVVLSIAGGTSIEHWVSAQPPEPILLELRMPKSADALRQK